MKFLSLISAGALVLLTDVLVLVGVSVNRSQTTEEIELTEREVTLQLAGEDNTGVSLRLSHIGAMPFRWLRLPEKLNWFDQAKLAEIGFDVGIPLTDPAAEIRYRNVLLRDAFVVLEYGGQVWEKWVKQAEESERRFSPAQPAWSPRDQTTHLIAVDAGRDPAALRRKYPDAARYLIVRAVVRLLYQKTWDPNTRQMVSPKSLWGEIQAVTPDEIHVPLPQAAALSGLPTDHRQPRYAATLRYGAHYEPWVVNIHRM